MEQRKTIDDAICNLEYYSIKMAQYLADVLDVTARTLALDKEYNREFKQSLKKDLAFTSMAIRYLGTAADHWKGMYKALEQLEGELDKKLIAGVFDDGAACTLDLTRICLTYMMLCYDSPGNETKIHDFLKNEFEWPEDLTRIYDSLTARIAGLSRQEQK